VRRGDDGDEERHVTSSCTTAAAVAGCASHGRTAHRTRARVRGISRCERGDAGDHGPTDVGPDQQIVTAVSGSQGGFLTLAIGLANGTCPSTQPIDAGLANTYLGRTVTDLDEPVSWPMGFNSSEGATYPGAFTRSRSAHMPATSFPAPPSPCADISKAATPAKSSLRSHSLPRSCGSRSGPRTGQVHTGPLLLC
jgi:hypothetical protein